MNLFPVSRVGRAACALAMASVLAVGAKLTAQAAKPAAAAASAKFPLTRPERTDYAETSRYEDVIAYMQLMAAANPQIHLTTYGYTRGVRCRSR